MHISKTTIFILILIVMYPILPLSLNEWLSTIEPANDRIVYYMLWLGWIMPFSWLYLHYAEHKYIQNQKES